MRTLTLDLDGTLLDCGPRQVQTLDIVLGEPYPEPEAFWQAKRGGATTREALMQLGATEEHAHAIADRWRVTVEDDAMLALDTLLPGAIDVLTAARTQLDRMVVVTARQRGDAAREQCRRLGLMELLDEVIAVPPVGASDNKAVVLRELAPLGFIGDTASDAHAAAAAAVPFAAVTTGQHTRVVLERAVKAPIVDSLADAVRLLV